VSEGKERAQSRLENLQAIEPLISSLRVLSLSTMQMATNRQGMLDDYAERFNEVAGLIRKTANRKTVMLTQEETFNFRSIDWQHARNRGAI
jgi:hypothetical protein